MAVTYVYISNEPLYNTSQGIIEVEQVNTLYAILSLSFVILGLFLMRYYALKSGIRYHDEETSIE